MKKQLYRLTAVLLAAFMLVSGVGNAGNLETVSAAGSIRASQYLYPFEEAVQSLGVLAEEHSLPAVIYLAESVPMRELPDEGSAVVKELVSGDVVRILGAGQDADCNIWYLVSYTTESETVEGYVPRGNLACVEESFLQWESNYVRKIQVFRRMAVPTGYPDVDSFPQSYREALAILKQSHPNWIFVPMETGISWNTLLDSQLGERSLIWADSPADWKNGHYGGNWAYASEGILKYYLDPRNGLTEKGIFQFELLGYSSAYHTAENVGHILSGTFMQGTTLENGKTYAQTFVELGAATQVSPFLMASRVRQEQGAGGTSPLISGTYAGYEGYYNYYNIGASGKTEKEVIENGLAKAKEEGWNTRYKSLEAGAGFLGGNYLRHGQDTLYLQKFDVDNRYDGIFWHQYMQNIEAPYKEALSVRGAYEKAGLLNNPYVFRIPVYRDMPSTACVLPGQEDKITLSSTDIQGLQVDSSITLYPFINGKEATGVEMVYSSSDESVAVVDEAGKVTALMPGETTITCRKKEGMDNTIEGTCKITVVKADQDLADLELPVPEPVKYDPAARLEQIWLPEGYTWVEPMTVPTVNRTAYGVVYNPDPLKYNSIAFDLTLTVEKATPQYTAPEGLTGGASRPLSSVLLPVGFSWTDPESLLPEREQTVTVMAEYNPDPENYETVKEIQVAVQVVCEKHSFTDWKEESPVCEAEGHKVRSCTICGEEERITLPALVHAYQSRITLEPTEEAEGERTYTCLNCGHTYSEVLPKLEPAHRHQYVEETIVKASCTTAGLIRYTCDCKDSYEEVLPQTGHEMRDSVCINCGYGKEEEPPVVTPDPPKEEEPPVVTPETPKEPETGKEPESPKEEPPVTTPETPKEPETGKESESPKEEEPPAVTPETPKEPETPQEPEQPTQQQPQQPVQQQQPTQQQPQQPVQQQQPTQSAQPQQSVHQTQPVQPQQQSPQTPAEGTTRDPGRSEAQLMDSMVQEVNRDDASQNSKAEKVIVELNKNTRISREIIEMAASHKVDLELKLNNGLVWQIHTEGQFSGIMDQTDMNAGLTEGVIDTDKIQELTKGRDYLELSLAHDGEFGFTGELKVPVDKAYIGQVANLFYMNEGTGNLEYQMHTPVTAEATILLSFSHASDYLIVFAQDSMEAEAVITEEEQSSVQESESVPQPIEAEEEEKGFAATLILIPAVIAVLAVVIVLLIRKKKEDRYFDEDIDDYREKS